MTKRTLLFILLLLALTACDRPAPTAETEASISYGAALDLSHQLHDLEREKDALKSEQFVTIRIAAVGDLLMHIPVINDAAIGSGRYDFTHQFEAIRPLIEEADIAIANLETTFTGPQVPYHGFPRFNAPDDLAHSLVDVGFDVITTANNHSLDGGIDGLDRTLDVLDDAGLQATGTFRSSDPVAPLLVEREGLQIGILNYTYGTNGLPLPVDRPEAVNLIDTSRILRDVTALRSADLIVVALHFGHEYHRTPSAEQIALVDTLHAAGVDIILGAHPHVLQPAEQKRPDRFTIYSMGNFLSNQRKRYQDAGVIVDLLVTFDRLSGKRWIDATLHPTWVERTGGPPGSRYRILPIAATLEDPTISEALRRKLMTVQQDSLGILNRVE